MHKSFAKRFRLAIAPLLLIFFFVSHSRSLEIYWNAFYVYYICVCVCVVESELRTIRRINCVLISIFIPNHQQGKKNEHWNMLWHAARWHCASQISTLIVCLSAYLLARSPVCINTTFKFVAKLAHTHLAHQFSINWLVSVSSLFCFSQSTLLRAIDTKSIIDWVIWCH